MYNIRSYYHIINNNNVYEPVVYCRCVLLYYNMHQLLSNSDISLVVGTLDRLACLGVTLYHKIRNIDRNHG